MTSGESRVVKGISRDSGNGSTRIEAIGLAALREEVAGSSSE
jgi:hypothetical protein